MSFSRRDFLKLAGLAGGYILSSPAMSFGLNKLQIVKDPFDYPYQGWDVYYKNQWQWDRVARSTHGVNCTGSCSWLVYTKDGIVTREEQAADYEVVQKGMPDYNPRGCQKGACYSMEYIYGDRRIKYPMLRVGERGEGKWKRISWDEAGDIFAEKLIQNINKNGLDSIFYYTVIPAMSMISFVAGNRFAHITGGVLMSFYDWYSDLPPGSPITLGVQTDVPESADWINAKYILLWGSNVVETRIPDAHYVTEARYKGAKVVSVFPDYNPSSIHSDIFLSPKTGTDLALLLSVINVILENNLYDEKYIKEQTDLTFLVDTATKKFLRQSDVVKGGRPDIFYQHDKNKGLIQSNGKTLKLNGLNPELEGDFEVKYKDGSAHNVKTVFSILKERFSGYTPEWAEKITGISRNTIDDFAKDIGITAKKSGGKVLFIHGNGLNQWFNNDLNNRSVLLLLSLLGSIGKQGGGFAHYVGQEKVWPMPGLLKLAFGAGMPKNLIGPLHQRFQNTTIWSYVHSNMPDLISEKERQRQEIPKPVRDYIYESVKHWEHGDKTWQRLYPKGCLGNDKDEFVSTGKTVRDPKMMVIWRANYLNQAKGFNYVKDNLWKKLDFIVDINFRMDSTALNADMVLPASSFYEKWDINSTDLTSFIIPFTPAVHPLYESKTDWQIWEFLAKKLSQKAKEENLKPVRDKEFGITRDFSKTHEIYTMNGKLADDKDAIQFILNNALTTKGMTLADTIKKPMRVKRSGLWTGFVKKGVPYTAFTKNTEGKKPYATLTKRQQYYIDQDWFLDFDEQLPKFKPPLGVDMEKYPLRLVTPHQRWSVHSTWRDAKTMLRLQRFRPVVYISPQEAKERNIADNDQIRVYNENGEFVARAYIAGKVKKGQAIMYHGWETYMDFKKGGFQSVSPIFVKPTQLVGGYGQLHFMLNYWGPTGVNKDDVVQIEKYNGTIS